MSSYLKLSIVLDLSGSMIDLNPFLSLQVLIDDQKELDKLFKLSLLTVSGRGVNIIYDDVNGKDIHLNEDDFIPMGATPLYDGIGKALTTLIKRNESNVLFVIITDGQDTSSTRYNVIKIRQLFKQVKDLLSFKVIFIGTNQDSFEACENLGICNSISSNFSPNRDGLLSVMTSLSRNISSCISENIEVEKFTPNILSLDLSL